ncbi:AAA family ATPase [Pseudomonas asiatica]|nr:AAA family ATPase [Pseudomonas asiatica]
MSFPLELTAQITSHSHSFSHQVTLNRGLTVVLGPNGSGKTHLLRGLKSALGQHTQGKHVRFLSAGRMGTHEQYRSDFDGYRGGTPRYEDARFGSKSDGQRRHVMETLDGDFQTLAERVDILIKIQERLRKLFKRDVLLDWDGGTLKVSFSRLTGDSQPYSSGREASGLLHLVGILAALYDDEVGALLLDEPEVSLHPQLQAFLLNEIIQVSGYPNSESNKKIVVIATHSTEMLKIQSAQDLLSLICCYDLQEGPLQIPADAGELQNRKVQSLVARLGQEHKLALFAKSPLLVEGPSDVIICSALCNKLDMHLEAAGSQLLPVIGKGQMPTVFKLLRLLGKKPVALADADGIADGVELANAYLNADSKADQRAAELGSPSASQLCSAIYGDFSRLVDARWGEVSRYAELHPYWINKNSEDVSLAKRRSAFCVLFTVNDSDLANLASDNAWLSMKIRLKTLLELLEHSGLFVLRKGSIESYYQHASQLTSTEKASAAVHEVEQLSQSSAQEVRAAYDDVVRCIQQASDAEVICEADALRDLLLSVVPPAHYRFKHGDVNQNFNVLAKSLVGEKSKIFNLEVSADTLTVSVTSKILDIKGFPTAIGKDDDVPKCINAALATPA